MWSMTYEVIGSVGSEDEYVVTGHSLIPPTLNCFTNSPSLWVKLYFIVYGLVCEINVSFIQSREWLMHVTPFSFHCASTRRGCVRSCMVGVRSCMVGVRSFVISLSMNESSSDGQEVYSPLLQLM